MEDNEDNNNNNNSIDIYTNNNYSNINNNLLGLTTPSSPSLRCWQRLSRTLVGLPCLFVHAPRRYAAIPRSPTHTDRLETEQVASLYRAARAAHHQV